MNKIKIIIMVIISFISFQSQILISQTASIEFKVNDDYCTSGALQTNLDGAPGIMGSMNLSVWVDQRNGANDVYGTFWNNDRAIYGNNIRFTENPSNQITNPKAASNSLYEYTVTWTFDGRLYAQKLKGGYEIAYEKEGEIIDVLHNNTLFRNNIYHHDIAMDDYTSMVVFYSSAEGQNNIYVNNISGIDFDYSNPVQINDAEINQLYYGEARKIIAADFKRTFAVVWAQTRENKDQIYIQLINGSQKIGENILVSQDINSNNFNPSISADREGNFLIVWEKREVDVSDKIYGRYFNKNNGFLTDEFKVNPDDQYGAFSDAISGSDELGNFHIAWRDYKNIYNRKFSTSGEPIGDMTTVINDAIFNNMYNFSMLPSANERKVFVWLDDRKGGMDVYSKGYDYYGNPQQTLQLNDDAGSAWQQHPSVFVNDLGKYAVVWEDFRNGESDIYLQMYDEENNRIADNIPASTSADNFIKDANPVGFWIDDELIVFWNSGNKIKAQKFSSRASRIGENVILVEENYPSEILSVKRSVVDSYAVAWRNSDGEKIKVGHFSQSFNQIGDIKIIEEPNSYVVDISFSENLDLGIIWQYFGPPNSENNIIIQKYNSAGEKYGDVIYPDLFNGRNFSGVRGNWINREFIYTWCVYNTNYGSSLHLGKYGQNSVQTLENIASISFGSINPISLKINSSDEIVVTWMNGSKLFFRKFEKSLVPIGRAIIASENFNYTYYKNSMEIKNSKLISVFEDYETEGHGVDIMAYVANIDKYNYVVNNFENSFVRNYPNPFNGTTKIIYSLSEPSYAEVSVFNILGERIEELFKGWNLEGKHELTFNATNLNSGIYFCSIVAGGNITVVKMLLIK